MSYSAEGVSLFETSKIKADRPSIICGLPDVGLVGIIAVSHIIRELKMEEVGYIDSLLFPPTVVFHEGLPTYPLRLYKKDNLLAVFSETSLTPESIYPLSKVIVGWAKNKDASLLISLGGIGMPNRIDIDVPKVYGASNNLGTRESIKNKEIPLLEEGFLVGPYALISKFSISEDLPNLILLAEAYQQYPDPGAAAVAIEALKKFIPLEVNVKSLLDRSEEIRLRARELMRNTSESMQKMGKSQEYELPFMYV
jgi:uncharacterized protein